MLYSFKLRFSHGSTIFFSSSSSSSSPLFLHRSPLIPAECNEDGTPGGQVVELLQSPTFVSGFRPRGRDARAAAATLAQAHSAKADDAGGESKAAGGGGAGTAPMLGMLKRQRSGDFSYCRPEQTGADHQLLQELIADDEKAGGGAFGRLMRKKCMEDRGKIAHINHAVRATAAALLHLGEGTLLREAHMLAKAALFAEEAADTCKEKPSKDLLKVWKTANKMRTYFNLKSGSSEKTEEKTEATEATAEATAEAEDGEGTVDPLQRCCEAVIGRAQMCLRTVVHRTSAAGGRWKLAARAAVTDTSNALRVPSSKERKLSSMGKMDDEKRAKAEAFHGAATEMTSVSKLTRLLDFEREAAAAQEAAMRGKKTAVEIVLEFLQTDVASSALNEVAVIRTERAGQRRQGIELLLEILESTGGGDATAGLLLDFQRVLQQSTSTGGDKKPAAAGAAPGEDAAAAADADSAGAVCHPLRDLEGCRADVLTAVRRSWEKLFLFFTTKLASEASVLDATAMVVEETKDDVSTLRAGSNGGLEAVTAIASVEDQMASREEAFSMWENYLSSTAGANVDAASDLQGIFAAYDADGNGSLDAQEMPLFLHHYYYSTARESMVKNQASKWATLSTTVYNPINVDWNRLSEHVLQDLTLDGHGGVSFAELQRVVQTGELWLGMISVTGSYSGYEGEADGVEEKLKEWINENQGSHCLPWSTIPDGFPAFEFGYEPLRGEFDLPASLASMGYGEEGYATRTPGKKRAKKKKKLTAAEMVAIGRRDEAARLLDALALDYSAADDASIHKSGLITTLVKLSNARGATKDLAGDEALKNKALGLLRLVASRCLGAPVSAAGAGLTADSGGAAGAGAFKPLPGQRDVLDGVDGLLAGRLASFDEKNGNTAAEDDASGSKEPVFINVKVVSCAHPNSNAEIWVNGDKVNDGITNTGGNKRGHHVAVIDEVTGEVLDVKCFDTWGLETSSQEMLDFLGDAADGQIIAFAICDSGDNYVEASMDIFRALGCENQPGSRVSQACVGQKGSGKAAWWRFAEGSEGGPAVTVETEAPVIKGGGGGGDRGALADQAHKGIGGLELLRLLQVVLGTTAGRAWATTSTRALRRLVQLATFSPNPSEAVAAWHVLGTVLPHASMEVVDAVGAEGADGPASPLVEDLVTAVGTILGAGLAVDGGARAAAAGGYTQFARSEDESTAWQQARAAAAVRVVQGVCGGGDGAWADAVLEAIDRRIRVAIGKATGADGIVGACYDGASTVGDLGPMAWLQDSMAAAALLGSSFTSLLPGVTVKTNEGGPGGVRGVLLNVDGSQAIIGTYDGQKESLVARDVSTLSVVPGQDLSASVSLYKAVGRSAGAAEQLVASLAQLLEVMWSPSLPRGTMSLPAGPDGAQMHESPHPAMAGRDAVVTVELEGAVALRVTFDPATEFIEGDFVEFFADEARAEPLEKRVSNDDPMVYTFAGRDTVYMHYHTDTSDAPRWGFRVNVHDTATDANLTDADGNGIADIAETAESKGEAKEGTDEDGDEPAEWTCGECENVNEPGATACDLCASEKPSGPKVGYAILATERASTSNISVVACLAAVWSVRASVAKSLSRLMADGAVVASLEPATRDSVLGALINTSIATLSHNHTVGSGGNVAGGAKARGQAVSAAALATMELKVGDFVKRGADWKWDEQDGGDGKLGKVTEIKSPQGSGEWSPSIRIEWVSPNASNNSYRYKDGMRDVLLVTRADGSTPVVAGSESRSEADADADAAALEDAAMDQEDRVVGRAAWTDYDGAAIDMLDQRVGTLMSALSTLTLRSNGKSVPAAGSGLEVVQALVASAEEEKKKVAALADAPIDAVRSELALVCTILGKENPDAAAEAEEKKAVEAETKDAGPWVCGECGEGDNPADRDICELCGTAKGEGGADDEGESKDGAGGEGGKAWPELSDWQKEFTRLFAAAAAGGAGSGTPEVFDSSAVGSQNAAAAGPVAAAADAGDDDASAFGAAGGLLPNGEVFAVTFHKANVDEMLGLSFACKKFGDVTLPVTTTIHADGIMHRSAGVIAPGDIITHLNGVCTANKAQADVALGMRNLGAGPFNWTIWRPTAGSASPRVAATIAAGHGYMSRAHATSSIALHLAFSSAALARRYAAAGLGSLLASKSTAGTVSLEKMGGVAVFERLTGRMLGYPKGDPARKAAGAIQDMFSSLLGGGGKSSEGTALMLKVAMLQLLRTEAANKIGATMLKREEKVVESAHSYESNCDAYQTISFPGAKSITLTFSDRCSTEQSYDYLALRKTGSERDDDQFWGPTKRYSGTSRSCWPQEPIVVPSDSFVAHFHSDGSGEDWGYQFTAVAEVPGGDSGSDQLEPEVKEWFKGQSGGGSSLEFTVWLLDAVIPAALTCSYGDVAIAQSVAVLLESLHGAIKTVPNDGGKFHESLMGIVKRAALQLRKAARAGELVLDDRVGTVLRGLSRNLHTQLETLMKERDRARAPAPMAQAMAECTVQLKMLEDALASAPVAKNSSSKKKGGGVEGNAATLLGHFSEKWDVDLQRGILSGDPLQRCPYPLVILPDQFDEDSHVTAVRFATAEPFSASETVEYELRIYKRGAVTCFVSARSFSRTAADHAGANVHTVTFDPPIDVEAGQSVGIFRDSTQPGISDTKVGLGFMYATDPADYPCFRPLRNFVFATQNPSSSPKPGDRQSLQKQESAALGLAVYVNPGKAASASSSGKGGKKGGTVVDPASGTTGKLKQAVEILEAFGQPSGSKLPEAFLRDMYMSAQMDEPEVVGSAHPFIATLDEAKVEGGEDGEGKEEASGDAVFKDGAVVTLSFGDGANLGAVIDSEGEVELQPAFFVTPHAWSGVGRNYFASGGVEVSEVDGWSCQFSKGGQRGFATVWASGVPMMSGKWYYEWECVVSGGCHQIGWGKADGSFAPVPGSGSGVGDCSNSWGCDLGRERKWHNGSESFGDSWEDGATVGCAVDLDAGTMSFSKNGSWDGPWGEAFTGVDAGEGGLVPAASFEGRFVGKFRLSADAFKHAPPSADYKAVSEAGSLACTDAHMFKVKTKKVIGDDEQTSVVLTLQNIETGKFLAIDPDDSEVVLQNEPQGKSGQWVVKTEPFLALCGYDSSTRHLQSTPSASGNIGVPEMQAFSASGNIGVPLRAAAPPAGVKPTMKKLASGEALDVLKDDDMNGDGLAFVSADAKVIESPHEYSNSSNIREPIEFPDAEAIRIVFDSQCNTERNYDYVRFLKGDGGDVDQYWGKEKYAGDQDSTSSGEPWPGCKGTPGLVIPAGKCTLYFRSDDSNVRWGYKFTATPLRAVKAVELKTVHEARLHIPGADSMLLNIHKLTSLGRGAKLQILNAEGEEVAEVDAKPEPGHEKLIQSAHPYQPNARDKYPVSFPGATGLRFTFLQGETESGCDHVTIYKKAGSDDKFGGPWSGTSRDSWPGMTGGAMPALEVSGDSALVSFYSDSSCEKTGWKLQVEALGLPPPGLRVAGDTVTIRALADVELSQDKWGWAVNAIPTLGVDALEARHAVKLRQFKAKADGPWTRGADVELVKHVNSASARKNLDPSKGASVDWNDLAPSMDDLQRLPSLRRVYSALGGGGETKGESKDDAEGKESKEGDAGGGGGSSLSVADALAPRFRMIQELNRRVVGVLDMIDLGNAQEAVGTGSLADMFFQCREVVFNSIKEPIWSKAIQRTASQRSEKSFKLQMGRRKAFRLREQEPWTPDLSLRRALFAQAFRQLHHDKTPADLRAHTQLWDTIFHGERSHDCGGPYREAFEEFANEMMSSALPLFVPCRNHQYKVPRNKDCWVLDPSDLPACPDKTELLEFVGKMMGIAIRQKLCLQVRVI